jgi:hypothetical protein
VKNIPDNITKKGGKKWQNIAFGRKRYGRKERGMSRAK